MGERQKRQAMSARNGRQIEGASYMSARNEREIKGKLCQSGTNRVLHARKNLGSTALEVCVCVCSQV